MEFLADTWVLWLIISGVAVAGLVFYRQGRSHETGFYTSAADFSITTTLFSPRKGEGDLFLGYLVAMLSFSLFLAGLIRWISTIF